MKGDVQGSVVQARTIQGDVHLHTSAPPVHNPYLRAVRELAPRELVGRRDELDALANFCTSPVTGGRYGWWRGEAWSGKTALLSWFVLHPPPAVRLVPFFIVARSSKQNSRSDFVDNLLVQLSALLGLPSPQPPPALAEAEVLTLLDRAAEWCHVRGEHFVLVVDGLDEDHGVDGTGHAHSIAALLPAVLPEGMKVIVTGREFPPLPGDVPAHHPLHDLSVVRPLSPSPAAKAIRHEMERDLKKLLAGPLDGQDLLGLVTASGGGLTAVDLAELTGLSELQVEDRLHTVTGRNFQNNPDVASEGYLLAHEELQRTALDLFGARIHDYRNRLHDWAATYTARMWPPNTPEYLLRGYYAMLIETGDIDRAVVHATDPARQRLLRSRVNADGAALADITTAQDFLLRQEDSDPVLTARLAVHRQHLHRLNQAIPSWLPAGWTRLGDHERAEQMADSIPDLPDRVAALVLMSKTAREEQPSLAAKLLEKAAKIARPLNQYLGVRSLLSVSEAYAESGSSDRARELLDHVENESQRAFALASLAAATDEIDEAASLLAESDKIEKAARKTDGELFPFAERKMKASLDHLIATVAASAVVGDRERVGQALREIETRLTGDEKIFSVRAAVAAADAGEYDYAFRFERLAREVSEVQWVTMRIIYAAGAECPEEAESLARATDDDVVLCERLAYLAEAWVRQRDESDVRRLIIDIETTAERMPEVAARGRGMLWAALASANSSNFDRAMELARQYASSAHEPADLVRAIAASFMRAGRLDDGREMLILSEELARFGTDHAGEDRRWVLWIKTAVDVGDVARAIRHTAALEDETARSAAWTAIAEGAMAVDSLNSAIHALELIEVPWMQRRVRLDLIRKLTSTGDPGQAESIARTTPDEVHRVQALALAAVVLRKPELLDEAVELAVYPPGNDEDLATWLNLLEYAAELGDTRRVNDLAKRIRDAAQALTEEVEATETRTSSIASITHSLLSGRIRKITKLIDLLSGRIRTMTELIDEIRSVRAFFLRTPEPAYTSIIPEIDGLRLQLIPMEDRTLSWELTVQDWRYHVEELVELRPDAYSAIVEELDALAGARPGGPTGTS
ncbi:hypothetical protein [Saccharothrix sp. Mg75]|uniref:hypothetical protein n=1 Tax=Saccharothrix sp. Mg75 TaxID=3445357 RepID=UPI003EEE90C4